MLEYTARHDAVFRSWRRSYAGVPRPQSSDGHESPRNTRFHESDGATRRPTVDPCAHLVNHNPELELVAGPTEYPVFHEGGAPSRCGVAAPAARERRQASHYAAPSCACRGASRLPRRGRRCRGSQGWLVWTSRGHDARVLSEQQLNQSDASRMIRLRAIAAGIHAPIGNHMFRATGITAYFAKGGPPEHARRWRRTRARARPNPMTARRTAHTGPGRTDQAMIFCATTRFA